MLQMEKQHGVTHVVATPHFYAHHDSPKTFLAKRRDAEMRLREEMSKHEGLPELMIGAEVYYFSGISESDAIYELTIDHKKCILLEPTSVPWNEKMFTELENIWEKHEITPVIAHIDRYLSPLRSFGIPQRLAQLPVKVQANASFFLRRSTKHMAVKMLKKGQIHLLGSDCHNLNTRMPNMSAALDVIKHRCGEEMLHRIGDNSFTLLAKQNEF